MDQRSNSLCPDGVLGSGKLTTRVRIPCRDPQPYRHLPGPAPAHASRAQGLLHPVVVTALVANAGAALHGVVYGVNYDAALKLYYSKVRQYGYKAACGQQHQHRGMGYLSEQPPPSSRDACWFDHVRSCSDAPFLRWPAPAHHLTSPAGTPFLPCLLLPRAWAPWVRVTS